MAEASGSRTHLRHKVPHNGFEARTQHRPRLASRRDCTRSIQIDRCCCRCRRRDATLEAVPAAIPRSSNGRTAAFGAVNRGSNPCRGATFCNQQLTDNGAVPCTNFVPAPPSRVVELIDAVLKARWAWIRNLELESVDIDSGRSGGSPISDMPTMRAK